MARQAGRRLAAERRSLGITQAQLAQAMGVTPGRVSQIERGGPATIDATARYITALGGELDLVASLGGPPVIIVTTAGPDQAGRDQGRESAADADRPGSGVGALAAGYCACVISGREGGVAWAMPWS